MLDSAPSDTLLVQGLPLELDDDKLRMIFQQYGAVQCCGVLDPTPADPVGGRAGWVQMGTLTEATWLRQNLDQNIPVGLTTPVSVRYSGSSTAAATNAGMTEPVALGLGALASPQAQTPSLLGAGAAAGRGGPTPLPVGVMISGTVRRWDLQKGFGFIGPDLGGPDVFVHVKELTDGEVLVIGTKVFFEVMPDPVKGPGKYRAKTCMGAKPKESASSLVTSDRLYVVGLPMDITEETLHAIFGQYGTVTNAKKLPSQPGKQGCAALLKMADTNQAKWIVDNVDQNIPTGLTSPVSVCYAEHKGSGTSGPPPLPASTQMPLTAPAPLAIANDSFGKAVGVSSTSHAQGPYGTPAPVTGTLNAGLMSLGQPDFGAMLSNVPPPAGVPGLNGSPAAMGSMQLMSTPGHTDFGARLDSMPGSGAHGISDGVPALTTAPAVAAVGETGVDSMTASASQLGGLPPATPTDQAAALHAATSVAQSGAPAPPTIQTAAPAAATPGQAGASPLPVPEDWGASFPQAAATSGQSNGPPSAAPVDQATNGTKPSVTPGGTPAPVDASGLEGGAPPGCSNIAAG